MPYLNTFWTKYCNILHFDSSLLFKLQHLNQKKKKEQSLDIFFSLLVNLKILEVKVSNPEPNQNTEVEEFNDTEFIPCKLLFPPRPQDPVLDFCCLDDNCMRSRKLCLYLPL